MKDEEARFVAEQIAVLDQIGDGPVAELEALPHALIREESSVTADEFVVFIVEFRAFALASDEFVQQEKLTEAIRDVQDFFDQIDGENDFRVKCERFVGLHALVLAGVFARGAGSGRRMMVMMVALFRRGGSVGFFVDEILRLGVEILFFVVEDVLVREALAYVLEYFRERVRLARSLRLFAGAQTHGLLFLQLTRRLGRGGGRRGSWIRC